MTSSFPPNVGLKFFLVEDSDSATLTYPFNGFSIEVPFAGQPSDLDETVINGVTYVWDVTTLDDVANHILIGATVAASVANLKGALNAETTGGQAPGTTYGTGTVASAATAEATTDHNGTDARLHLTATSALAIDTSDTTNVDAQDWDGNSKTAFVHYAGGDWTKVKAQSATAARTGLTTVYGYAGAIPPYWNSGAPSTTDTSVALFNHSGVSVGSFHYNGGAGNYGFTSHVPIQFTGGVAARSKNTATGTFNLPIYVFYY
jgi:hypothetical protein